MTDRQNAIATLYYCSDMDIERLVIVMEIGYDSADGFTELWDALDAWHESK